jgi:hypothetical protein
VLSLRRREGNSKKSQRVLHAVSRFAETPSELLIELKETGYVALGDPHEAVLRDAKDSIIENAPVSEPKAITLKELMESAKLQRSTAQRAVEELQRDDVLGRVGTGKKASPYRYFLKGIP